MTKVASWQYIIFYQPPQAAKQKFVFFEVLSVQKAMRARHDPEKKIVVPETKDIDDILEDLQLACNNLLTLDFILRKNAEVKKKINMIF
jgi:hypothetical protein